jgi:A/G-specific adenine glycosylase
MTKISHSLHRWYAENKRSLPWRRDQNPYFIWISEIMLQQTTVAAVKPYFEKFILTFPTVEDLAKAREEKVLGLWSGLGYYSRARNLQKAAKEIVKRKSFPRTSTELAELSGIGPYTSAAIASIAFGEEIAAIDGNVIRVITRLYDINQDVGLKETQNQISTYATQLIRDQDPSIHNQAMMELGATICSPKNPSCLLCPIRAFCKSFKMDTVLERPVKKKNRSQEPWLWEMFLIKDEKGRIALVKSENGTPWLNHLWVLPGGAKPWKKNTEPKFNFKHSITHHKIFVRVKNQKVEKIEGAKNIKWIKARDLEKVGVSSIVQKALKAMTVATLFLFMGCKSAQTQNTPAVAASPTTSPVARLTGAITKVGENQMGQFSPDGSKIIFQSQSRPTHKKAQIYILNLRTNRERRITYNDGEDFSPTFDPTGEKILYSSTTDEIKEHGLIATPVTDPLLDNSKASFQEIYESRADGSHIVRLTHGPGFDGSGSYSSDGSRVAFASQRDGQFKIYVMDRKGRRQNRLTKSLDFEYSPVFSPKGRNIAYETHPNNSTSVQIATSDIYGKNIVPLTAHDGINRDPSWSPDGTKIIFSSNREDGKSFNLFLVTTDGKCLKKITGGIETDLFPSFSKDGKQIIYSSNKSGTFQIYIIDFEEPKDCLTDKS